MYKPSSLPLPVSSVCKEWGGCPVFWGLVTVMSWEVTFYTAAGRPQNNCICSFASCQSGEERGEQNLPSLIYCLLFLMLVLTWTCILRCSGTSVHNCITEIVCDCEEIKMWWLREKKKKMPTFRCQSWGATIMWANTVIQIWLFRQSPYKFEMLVETNEELLPELKTNFLHSKSSIKYQGQSQDSCSGSITSLTFHKISWKKAISPRIAISVLKSIKSKLPLNCIIFCRFGISPNGWHDKVMFKHHFVSCSRYWAKTEKVDRTINSNMYHKGWEEVGEVTGPCWGICLSHLQSGSDVWFRNLYLHSSPQQNARRSYETTVISLRSCHVHLSNIGGACVPHWKR